MAAGATVVADTRAAVDVAGVLVFVGLFLRLPFPTLLFLLVVAYKDNDALELAVFAGGGLSVLLVARQTLATPPAIFLGALVVLSLVSVPVRPTLYDGSINAQHYIPFTAIPFLGPVSGAFVEWWRLGFLYVATMLGAWLITSRRRLGLTVAACLIGTAPPVISGLQQLARGQYVVRTGSTQKAIQGPFPFPNPFAFFLLTGLLVGLVVMVQARSWRLRVLLLGLLGTTGTCFALTYTRSAWIGCAAGLVMLGVFQYRWLLPLGATILIVSIFAFPGATSTVEQRFSNQDSYSWRSGEWNAVLPLADHHPFDGTGFGSYQADTVRVFGYEDHRYPTLSSTAPLTSPQGFTAHNDYVRMLVELGYPGLILWCLVLLSVIVAVASAARAAPLRPVAAGVGAVMVAISAISYADNVQAYTVDLLYPFVLAAGLSTVARRELGRSG